MPFATRQNYNPNILRHVHTRKIACVARVKGARCGVLFTEGEPLVAEPEEAPPTEPCEPPVRVMNRF